MTGFAELAVTTNFSFLRGGSHPEELVGQAIALGLKGIGIADRNSLAGVVRAHVFVRENTELAKNFRVVTGARLVFADGTPDILAYPCDRAAYGRLSKLLTIGNLRAEKGQCHLEYDDLLMQMEGLQLIVMAENSLSQAGKGLNMHRISAMKSQTILDRLRSAAPGRVWLAASMTYGRHMRRDLKRRALIAQNKGLPLIATNDVLMHDPARRALQDVLTCIREHITLDEAGFLIESNAERHLKSPDEMARLFREAPYAIEETLRFLDGLSFSLDELRYEYPDETREGFATQQDALEAYVRAGAENRYPDGIPQPVANAIAHELKLVAELDYAAYFLTVHDIVRFARTRGILCQGRGSAANSALCFCLGITEVDPTKHDLLFERFISADRKEPPDIDVDFEHERREEVIQYIYARYGRERSGLAASVITYRARSAIREVGKAFALSEDVVSALSGTVWGQWSGTIEQGETRRIGLDPNEPRLSQAIMLAGELVGFPRHLSQHTGGFVITRTRLDEVIPIMNAAMDERTTVEWDKDDLDALGILKIDVLALGMLSCLRKGFDLLKTHYGRNFTLATLPAEETCIYAMISRADTIGVFQIESRAQMSMLPRLKPARFYDLVIEVAIVRPGPIQGDMVHPYLRRRQKLEEVIYPSKELEAVLGKTLGVPLFQEQAMKIAIVAAGFSPSEADRLRRAMATFKRVGTIGTFQTKMIEGMAARGYDRDFAERCFKQIEGFGTYGFPESHAASFALLVYASAWMKCRYPDVFACALLNAQPMGFYAPSQIVRDARDHGIEVREADVNLSDWDNILEANGSENAGPPTRLHQRHHAMQDDILSTHAIRLGLRQIKGIREDDMKMLVAARARGYDSVRDLWLRTGLSPAVLERLAEADAFRSLGLDRRDALWAIRGLNRSGDKDDLPLFAAAGAGLPCEPDAHLPPMPLGEHVVEDYRHLSLSLKAHPVAFVRQILAARNILRCEKLAEISKPDPESSGNSARAQNNSRVTVAGLVLVRQRPGSAKGVVFMTIEDETGIANIIVWQRIFERLRAIVIGARFIAVTGKLQNESGVIHIVAERVEDLTPLLGKISERGTQISDLARADELRRPQTELRDKMRERSKEIAPTEEISSLQETAPLKDKDAQRDMRQVLPKGRNFQ